MKGDNPACDRLRVIIPLERAITTNEEYQATWQKAKELWPFIDESCSDSCRYYALSIQVERCQLHGKTFPVERVAAPIPLSTSPATNQPQAKVAPPTHAQKLEPSKRTKQFQMTGATHGSWHRELVAACYDLKQQRWSNEDATAYLEFAARDFDGFLDEHDLKVIEDVFLHREVHSPRLAGRDEKVQADTQSTQISSRRYEGSTEFERMEKYREEKRLRQRATASAVPFLCNAFDDLLALTMGVCLVVGETGSGKTTTSANILANFYERCPGRSALVITNEENSADVTDRVSCVLLKQDFKVYRKGKLVTALMHQVDQMSAAITKYIEVVNDPRWDMNCLEDVQEVLRYAARKSDRFGIVIVDYVQNITASHAREPGETYKISKDFGLFVKDLAKTLPIPLVLFAQVNPSTKFNSTISQRVQNDKTFVNHAAMVIEIVRNQDFSTKFVIHKDRFGDMTGKSVLVDYVDGRFEKIQGSTVANGKGVEDDDQST